MSKLKKMTTINPAYRAKAAKPDKEMQQKDTPVMMKEDMVLAIEQNNKTQTRRLYKPGQLKIIYPQWMITDQPGRHSLNSGVYKAEIDDRGAIFALPKSGRRIEVDPDTVEIVGPLGKKGDRLWVREKHAIVPATAYRMSKGIFQIENPDQPHDAAVYFAGFDLSAPPWKGSIHMPRWAARITLEITRVRLQRLQAVFQNNQADCFAEGVRPLYFERNGGTETWYSMEYPAPDHPANCLATPQAALGNYFNRMEDGKNWNLKDAPPAWDRNNYYFVYDFRILEIKGSNEPGS